MCGDNSIVSVGMWQRGGGGKGGGASERRVLLSGGGVGGGADGVPVSSGTNHLRLKTGER